MKEKERKNQLGDLGMTEEVFELCKNLCSIEAHAFGSFVASQNEKWMKVSMEARKVRTKYLSLITKNENQTWCISKHIAESCMRLQETYTRFLSTNQVEEAKLVAEDYYKLYYLFLELNGVELQNVSTEKATSSA